MILYVIDSVHHDVVELVALVLYVFEKYDCDRYEMNCSEYCSHSCS
jgi:hypothetical protein